MTTDFTSGLFLGLTHAGECGPGPLTTGTPAALREVAGSRTLAREVALAHGAERGLLARSSLHALVDVLLTVSRGGGQVLLDEHAYPISHWAAAVARAKGATVHTFRHHDAADARRRLARRPGRPGSPGSPVVLTDGWCGGCLRPAPLADLLAVARGVGGVLVVDDSPAAGVLGRRTTTNRLFGVGGAGTPAWLGVAGSELVWVASTAKGLGAPLAVLTGPARVLDRVAAAGPARTHASPPSRCDVAALGSAWRDPTLEARRRRLAGTVLRVRDGLGTLGLPPVGLPFPVVAVDAGGRGSVVALHRRLRAHGVETLVVRAACRRRAQLTICLRADHTDRDVAALLGAVGRAAA